MKNCGVRIGDNSHISKSKKTQGLGDAFRDHTYDGIFFFKIAGRLKIIKPGESLHTEKINVINWIFFFLL